MIKVINIKTNEWECTFNTYEEVEAWRARMEAHLSLEEFNFSDYDFIVEE